MNSIRRTARWFVPLAAIGFGGCQTLSSPAASSIVGTDSELINEANAVRIGDAKALLQSDLLAAFLVAYEDYKEYMSAQGEAAGPRALMQRHGSISLSVDKNIGYVTFSLAESVFGGDIAYTVDLTKMVVLKREFPR